VEVEKNIKNVANLFTELTLQHMTIMHRIVEVGIGLILLTVVVAIAVGAYFYVRKVRYVRLSPGHDGQFPLIRETTNGGNVIVIDPNRVPAAAVAIDRKNGSVTYVFPADMKAQMQALRGAQRVQAIRAAVSGTTPTMLPLEEDRFHTSDEDRLGKPTVMEGDVLLPSGEEVLHG
jgi:hypothetical protein